MSKSIASCLYFHLPCVFLSQSLVAIFISLCMVNDVPLTSGDIKSKAHKQANMSFELQAIFGNLETNRLFGMA
jgi:hypothetical protein